MSLWIIIKNFGAIYDFFKLLSSILPRAVKEKKIPDCVEGLKLCQSLRILLQKGIIDVPGVDEKAIVEALLQIEERMSCQA